jgi:hypothetical protein
MARIQTEELVQQRRSAAPMADHEERIGCNRRSCDSLAMYDTLHGRQRAVHRAYDRVDERDIHVRPLHRKTMAAEQLPP